MLRLVLFLVAAVVVAFGASWLSDRPGTLAISWQGYELDTTVFRAVLFLALFTAFCMMVWSLVRIVWRSPAVMGRIFERRREQRGLDALSSGMIAIGAGDRSLATRYAVQARKALPNEPLTHLLRAQAAQLSGDRATSRRIFEAMLGSPDTEQLGLRGLFLEAEREGEREAARQFAERALQLNAKLSWSFDALFDLQCKDGDWAGALETLAIGRKNGHVERPDADRRRAVLLTGQAQALEDENGGKALDLAQEAHGLAPDLIPAAVIAGRQLASRGNTAKAAKIIERTWKSAPHPDLALIYAFARPGDSPRDRLDRVKRLARIAPHSSEGPIAVAQAAVEARNWAEARHALSPLLEGRLTQRVCTLMARIEGEEHQNAGGVREWLARAVNAPRDPAWTADGIVADAWAPTSPVTGALDAFQWKVPVEAAPGSASEQALERIEELVTLGMEQDGGLARRLTEDVAAESDDDAAPGVIDITARPVATEPTPPPVERDPVASAPQAATTGEPAVKAPAAKTPATESASQAPPAAAMAVPVTGPSNASAREAAATAKPSVMPAQSANTPSAGPTASASVAAAGTGANIATPFRHRTVTPPRAPDDPGTDDDAPMAMLQPDAPVSMAKR